MKTFRSIAVALVIVTLSGFAASQGTDAEAQSILDRAARFQRGDDPIPAAKSLYGRFYVTVRDDKGTFSAEIERWFSKKPERMLTRSVEAVTGTRSTVTYDNGTAWFRNDKTGEVRVYSDKPDLYDVDLAKLEEQLQITNLMLDAIAVDSLVPRLSGVRAVGSGTVTDLDGIEHPVDYVAATLPDVIFDTDPSTREEIKVRFAVGRDGALRKLDVASENRDRMSLVFGLHGRTKSGLSVPLNIKIFQGAEGEKPREIADLGVVEDNAGNAMLMLDAPVDARLFEVPER